MDHQEPDSPVDDPAVQRSRETSGQTIDAGRGRIFPCDQCGADLLFNIGDQRLKCPHCAFEKAIAVPPDAAVEERDLREMLSRLKEQGKKTPEREDDAAHNQVRCESCGANVVFVGTLTSFECPYCGSPIQREHVHSGGWRIPVDGVLPFAVERETAATSLEQWVRSRWFAPNEFLKRGAEGKFNGVYFPFWTFDAMTATSYRGQRGEWYWITVGSGKDEHRIRQTRWWPAAGDFQRFFDDLVVNAADGGRRDLIDELGPWPLQKCLPFTQQVLAGFLARTYDVELDQAFREAREQIQAAIETEVRQRIGGDEQSVEDIRTGYGALSFKHLLLPVWLLAYRYADKTYQVFVNAGTGEVQGERPYSAWKISFAVVLGLLAAGATFLLMNR